MRDRLLADYGLDRLNPTFGRPYSSEVQPSVPTEKMLLALLQAFYGICAEKLMLEQLYYNLPFSPLV